MINSKGKRVKVAEPSTAVEILGLSEVPQGGDQVVAANSCLTLSWFAPGLSILFIATINGTLAALAWFIAMMKKN